MRKWHVSGWRTMRVRLTSWYVLFLGVTLLLFCLYLYVQLAHSFLEQIDAGIEVAASQMLAMVNDESHPPAFRKTHSYQETVRHFSEVGLTGRLLTQDGTVLDGFGSYQLTPWSLPTTPGFVTQRARVEWRVYSQRIEPPSGHAVGWLQVAQPLSPIQSAEDALATQMLVGVPFVLLLAGLGGYLLATRALRPIDRITRTAHAISGTDLTERIGHVGPADEVGRLATTFDQMLDRVQAAFEHERRFTADAAHELRTPLAAIKGRIGVTLSRCRTSAEYGTTLRALDHEADRLIRLANDLLLLARLDQRRFGWEPEPLDVGEVLSAVIEEIQPLAQVRQITLTRRIAADLCVQGYPDQLIRLLLNLLDNAIKFTPASGEVIVQAETLAREVCITITDQGPGIPTEHLPHVFERFYRVESARSHSDGGSGLGLAITAEIARVHGGTLEVQSQPGCETSFIVRLPQK
jgi:heavy metal sensor kinase